MFQFNGHHPDPEAGSRSGHQPTSEATKAEKRQITRNRTSYSCLTCRRRKVKCDKLRPICGGCQKAKEQCIYSEDMPSSNGHPVPSKVDDTPVWKKRKSSLVGQESTPIVATDIVGPENTRPPTDLKAIEEQLLRLTRMVDALHNSKANELRLKDLLTPEPSSSESGSEGAHPPSSMSLDMFQINNHGSVKDPSDLSTPLSSLKLTNGDTRLEDPFWGHISDELDQLNHLMKRRDNTYASSLSPENKQCDRPRDREPPNLEGRELEQDDSGRPNDFHKEAGIKTLESLDPENRDSISHLLAFSKSSLLQNIPLKCAIPTAMRHLTQGLPTRAQSNVLFRCWLSGVYPIVGIFMPSEIAKKHEDFWDTVESTGISASQHPDLDTLTVLHAIWYAGSLSVSTKGLRQWFPEVSRARLSTQFHDQTVFCLLLGSFKRDISLYKLAALVLLQTMPVAEEDPLQGSLYLALILRLALSMGLHREPTLFELSVTEEGMRRRLWWQIIQLDILNVVASGYPSQIAEKFCDTRVICEDRDAYMSENASGSASSDGDPENISPQPAMSNGDAPNPAGFRTLSLLARGKSIMACALRSVVSIHLGTKTLRNTDVNEMKRIMAEAEEHIRGIIKAIPSRGLPEMGFLPDLPRNGHNRVSDADIYMGSPITSNDIAYFKTSPNNTDPSWPLASFYRQKQAAYNKWSRIALSMAADKMHCVAYAPFLKNTKSKLWDVGRQCALHNCHSFLRKFNSLASDPDLESFRWGWPALYGPLHSVLIVLVDLYERPKSVEAPRSRELVDNVFAFAAPESGIVGGSNGFTVQRPIREGGIEAWEMLRGLRAAAWQKAGLDPAVLWTEEDQITLGLATPLTDAQKIAQSLREDSFYEDRKPDTQSPCAAMQKATEQGVQDMIKMAQAEFSSDVVANGEETSCTGKARTRFLQGVERDARINPRIGLARREGQRLMPFPLSRQMQKCSGQAAGGTCAASVFDMHTNLPKPEATPRPCPSTMAADLTEAEATPKVESVNGMSHVLGAQGWDRPSIGGVADGGLVTNNQFPEQQTNGMVQGVDYTNGYGTHISSHGEQSHPDPSFSANGAQQGDTDMTLGFDWEKWDAVFGQYSGFTDFMDDETAWTEYVNIELAAWPQTWIYTDACLEAMDEARPEKTSWGVPKAVFDYSEVVTFSVGKGTDRQHFTFNSPQLCEESSYFEERLHGDCGEAKSPHFELPDVDPAVLACMLCWFRGWECSFCEHDRGHVGKALILAVEYCIPRYKEHLEGKLRVLGVEDASLEAQ
ncbi:hypothetical protein H2200_000309 [Cladophialophora chaetospira]|uniref:Zn(2)-C6 fungal-type domain-containing protein n=1 Tax=Cladophialophora chaetospira TaxID=386627 RepID=A0AA38XN70_9EURO|nr:hypothetical protein H2200_000309 [Cladophialophora chaetospira]